MGSGLAHLARSGRSLAALVLLLALVSCDSARPGGTRQGGSSPGGGGGSGGSISCRDDDADGANAKACGGTDCDDADAGVHPGALELCRDGVDQDCDGTADDGCECSAGDMRACWSGSGAARGLGQCADGFQRCSVHGAWSVCAGEVAPGAEPATCDGVDQDCDGRDAAACAGCVAAEVCGNGLDDDCDEVIDDPSACGASCLPAQDARPACCGDGSCTDLGCEARLDQNCYTGPPGTLGLGICRAGRASCEGGVWGQCAGEVTPASEICGNGLDDDCDGLIDESDAAGRRCPRNDCAATEVCGNELDDDCDGFVDEACPASATEQACYPGPVATRGRGVCKDGKQLRQDDGYWGPCVGALVPAGERCGDQIDSDCNGAGGPAQAEDAGCCEASGAETCNGTDDDCDGLVDEGSLNRCGDCAMSCPGKLELTDLDSCDRPGRTCTQIRPAGGGLAIDLEGALVPADAGLYFHTSSTVLRRFDTSTGKTDWDFTIPGAAPHPFAASPDGSVWYNGAFAELLHIDRDGKLFCSFPWPEDRYLGPIAVDETGAAWAVFMERNRTAPAHLYKFPPDNAAEGICIPAMLTPESDALPLELRALEVMVAGRPPTLWLGPPDIGDWGLRLNRETLEQTQVIMQWPSRRILVDHDGALLLQERLYGLKRIAEDDDGTKATYYNQWILYLGGIGDGGRIWGNLWLSSSYPFGYFDMASGKTHAVELPESLVAAGQAAVDAAGRVWVTALNNEQPFLASYEPATEEWTEFLDQRPLGDSSDVEVSVRTSAALQRYLDRKGSVVQLIDGGSSTTHWKQVTWSGEVPEGTQLNLTVNVADAPGDLDGSGCGPFASSPADLSSCAPPSRGRYLQLSFELKAKGQATPTLAEVSIDYDRP